ncbi:MAG: alanine racemase [Pseudomonadota bacterium]
MTTAPRLTINLSAIVENWKLLAEKSGMAEASAVIKANAYGLGIEQVAERLSGAGCNTFFVALAEEGVRVRSVAPDARIFVLNGIIRDTVEMITEHDLAPVLSSMDQIAMWVAAGSGRPSAIHVDTGMNRLGLSVAEAELLAQNNTMVARSGAKALMSHLSCADEPDHELNALQLSRFTRVSRMFPGLEMSLANSAAILSNTEMQFDLTRPGIAIFGGEAVNNLANPMQTVVTAKARILQVRDGKKGETVGYGAAHTLGRDSKIAICSAGYADGFHRASSGAGVPLRETGSSGGAGAIGDNRVPVLGRVSMDLTAFDVTDVPPADIEATSYIELFGSNISLDEAARSCGTIGYELLTGLGSRYIREYVY